VPDFLRILLLGSSPIMSLAIEGKQDLVPQNFQGIFLFVVEFPYL
jgi:hypothetical protein